MQQRYLMTSCTVGNFGKDYNVCPLDFPWLTPNVAFPWDRPP